MPTENLAEFFQDTPQEGAFRKREESQMGIKLMSGKVLQRYFGIVEIMMKKYDFLDCDNKLTQALTHGKAGKFISFISNVIYPEDSFRAIGIEYKLKHNYPSCSQNWTMKLDTLIAGDNTKGCCSYVKSLFAERTREHNTMKEVIDSTIIDSDLKHMQNERTRSCIRGTRFDAVVHGGKRRGGTTAVPSTWYTVPVCKSKKQAQTTRRRDWNPRPPYLNYCQPDTTIRQKPALCKHNCCCI